MSAVWCDDDDPGPTEPPAVEGLYDHFIDEVVTSSSTVEQSGKTIAAALIAIANQNYHLVTDAAGVPMAVPKHGPNVARPLRGDGSLRSELAAAYYKGQGKPPSQGALTDALTVIEGQASGADRQDAHLRVGSHASGIVLDLGGVDGRVILVTATGWEIRNRSPVLLKRTKLTARLEEPSEPGDLEPLRDLVNVDDRHWPLLVGWLVAALLPDLPHPIMLLSGEQGTGKTTAAKLVAGLIDPSPAQVRSAPKDIEGWQIAAAGSWVVPLDNLSGVQGWLSDALCRAVTGEGLVKRALYTDDGLSLISYRRCVMLTSIDAGSMRGDLLERLVPIELHRITGRRRRTDRDLDAAYQMAKPTILAGLLDLTAAVIAALPAVHLIEHPRMADFARVLAALDTVTGWASLDTYTSEANELAAALVQDDPVASAVVALVDGQPGHAWEGTKGDLLEVLSLPDRQGVPKSARGLGGSLKRLAPALSSAGVEYLDLGKDRDGHKVRLARP